MSAERGTVLVTGGLGYIGSFVLPRLIAQGWRVRVLDDLSRSVPTAESAARALGPVEVVVGDIRDRPVVDEATRGVQVVIHLAAMSLNRSIVEPRESLEVNLMATEQVIEAAVRHDVRRVVFASSASTYGRTQRLPMAEDDRLNPITPYCMAKAVGEQLLSFYAARSTLTWLALRFFNVYGPDQHTDAYYTSVIPAFLSRLAAGLPPIIDGHGHQSMDFVHVRDVARAVDLAVHSRATGQALNVGSGSSTTIAELAERLIKLWGADLSPEYLAREVLVDRRQADPSRCRAVLGWKPEIDLDEGLREVIERSRGARG